MKKAKKFNCKQEISARVHRDDSYHTLSRDSQKVGIEEHRNSAHFYGAIESGDGKCGCNFSFDDVPEECKQVRIERRFFCILQIQMKRRKITIMLQRIVKRLKTKNEMFN